MNTQELFSAYSITDECHETIAKTLSELDENQPMLYQRRVKKIRLAVVFALILVILSTTVAAATTEFFGLFSRRVGSYGLDIIVDDSNEKVVYDNVKFSLGYIPDGYEPAVEDGVINECRYTYGGENDSDRFFILDLVKSEEFVFEEKYVVQYKETEFDGHKTVFMARQFEKNGKIDGYLSVKYFEDMGYVVTCYCDDYSELKKITEHLSLIEDDAEPEPTVAEREHPTAKGDDYSFNSSEKYKVLNIGDSFDYSDNVFNSENPADYTITVKSIDERSGFDGLKTDCILHEWQYETYFNNNGELITPYTRTDRKNGDGVNSLDEISKTVDDRHFYILTFDVKANVDDEQGFDIHNIYVSNIIIDGENLSMKYNYGNVELIYIEPSAPYGNLNIDKGTTQTIYVGVVCDDDVLNDAYLEFRKIYIDIDDAKCTATERIEYYCVMLNSEVDYD